MNRRLPILLAFLCACPAIPAQQPAETPTPPEAESKINDAQELMGRDRYVDALAKLDEAEALAPRDPRIPNLRGSIHLSRPLRDIAEATSQFAKAEQLMPGTVVVAFNKAEVQFVKHDWPAALSAFQKILTDFPKIPEETRHLVLYKRLIAEVKTGQIEAAQKTVKENFTFMDDTPAYYYAHAAIAFQAGDEAKAKDWMERAESIFKPAESAPYVDSLKEARWIPDIGLPPIVEK
jgi:tetratricopeptide (TPR) repeat protein